MQLNDRREILRILFLFSKGIVNSSIFGFVTQQSKIRSWENNFTVVLVLPGAVAEHLQSFMSQSINRDVLAALEAILDGSVLPF